MAASVIRIHELKIYWCDKIHYPTSSYLFKVNRGNTRAVHEICSKLKIKTPEQCQWHSSMFLISNFEHISLSISKCLMGTFRYNYFIIYWVTLNKFRSSHQSVMWEKVFGKCWVTSAIAWKNISPIYSFAGVSLNLYTNNIYLKSSKLFLEISKNSQENSSCKLQV